MPTIDLGSGFKLEIMGVLGMAGTARRSKDPNLFSVTIIAIHSAMAHAVEKLWDSAPRVDDTTLGSL